MSKNREERQCTICHQTYRYCGCAQYAHLPRWMDAYCSANCHDLYNVTAGYINHWLDPEVEIARLQKLDLSYFDRLPDWMQETIKEMLSHDATNAAAINQVYEAALNEASGNTTVEVKPEVAEEIKSDVAEEPELEVFAEAPAESVAESAAENEEAVSPAESSEVIKEEVKEEVKRVVKQSPEYVKKPYNNKPYKKGGNSHKN